MITGFDGSTLGREDTRHDILNEDNINITENKNRPMHGLTQNDEGISNSSNLDTY